MWGNAGWFAAGALAATWLVIGLVWAASSKPAQRWLARRIAERAFETAATDSGGHVEVTDTPPRGAS